MRHRHHTKWNDAKMKLISIWLFALYLIAVNGASWHRQYVFNITDEEALERAREVLSNYPLVDG